MSRDMSMSEYRAQEEQLKKFEDFNWKVVANGINVSVEHCAAGSQLEGLKFWLMVRQIDDPEILGEVKKLVRKMEDDGFSGSNETYEEPLRQVFISFYYGGDLELTDLPDELILSLLFGATDNNEYRMIPDPFGYINSPALGYMDDSAFNPPGMLDFQEEVQRTVDLGFIEPKSQDTISGFTMPPGYKVSPTPDWRYQIDPPTEWRVIRKHGNI